MGNKWAWEGGTPEEYVGRTLFLPLHTVSIGETRSQRRLCAIDRWMSQP